ncbi:MAG TPA: sigma factor, partial [Micromonosporaceae bacterium]
EAEDAVQETWLRYEASTAQPTSAKAFLSAVVTRVSIDALRSARVRRQTYVGHWFPEPLLTDAYEDPARSAELADSASMAALLLLERLTWPPCGAGDSAWCVCRSAQGPSALARLRP